MAEPQNRDLLDDIIDIQKDWSAVSNPLGNIVDTLSADPDKVRRWDPDEYKYVPRTNTQMCVTCRTKDERACSLCLDVCPVDAIRIEDNKLSITEDCRMCGLCVSVCPFEAITETHYTPRNVYDRIARAAAAHEVAYITCTRAIGRLPLANEVVLPCVGVVAAETWFALLAEYPNLSVYLPMGICDRCRTTTGETVYSTNIAIAEELAGCGIGLETEEAELDHEKKRAYERQQFVNRVLGAGVTLATAGNPMLLSARAITSHLRKHTERLNALQRTLRDVCGEATTSKKRRLLVQRRQLTMAALQDAPELADALELTAPACDSSKCTICGDCVSACPVNATDIDVNGRFSVEPAYCMSCGACVMACEEGALEMEPFPVSDLIVRDEDAEGRRAKSEQYAAEVERLKQQGREKLMRGLELLEALDDEDDSADGEATPNVEAAAPDDLPDEQEE